MKRLLTIDDNGQDIDKLKTLLREHGFSVIELGRSWDDGNSGLMAEQTGMTDLKSAEAALRLNQFIIDQASVGIFRGDADARIRYVNEYGARMLGYSREELLSMSFFDIDPTLTQDWWRKHRSELTARSHRKFESVHRRKDGTTFPVEVTVNYLEFGGYELSCSFAQDITERKAAEESLRQAALVLENSPAVLFRWRAAEGWPVEMVTKNVSRFGYSPEELLSGAVPFSSLIYSADLERVVSEVTEHTRRGDDSFQQEYRIVTREGQIRWVDDRTVVERNESGRVSHYQGVVLDITERKRVEDALRLSEQKYRTIVEHAPFGISRSTRGGKLLGANPAFARILKYDSPEQLMEAVNRSSIQDVLFEEPSRRGPLVERVFAGDSWYVFENRYRCKDGSIITCKVHSRRIRGQAGKEDEFESFIENITERVEAENALRESEQKFRVLAETAPVAIVVYQGERFVYMNPAAIRLFGYPREELPEMDFWAWANEESQEMSRGLGIARQPGARMPIQYEHGFVKNNGDKRWVLVSAGAIEYQGKPAGIATFIDITAAKEAEERLQASLAEKEVLLKEVHHRVKNNLQVISSLLDLQSEYIKDEHLLQFFRESRDRIKTMALVHERLYNSEDFTSIDFRDYVENLVAHLAQSYVENPDRISFRLEMTKVPLAIHEAIPCGLIINELVSNAMKHAFPPGRKGEITVACREVSDGTVRLEVGDNGVGLPAGLDFRNTETLGLQLVTMLVRQLRGRIEMSGDAGILWEITFNPDRPGRGAPD